MSIAWFIKGGFVCIFMISDDNMFHLYSLCYIWLQMKVHEVRHLYNKRNKTKYKNTVKNLTNLTKRGENI